MIELARHPRTQGTTKVLGSSYVLVGLAYNYSTDAHFTRPVDFTASICKMSQWKKRTIFDET